MEREVMKTLEEHNEHIYMIHAQPKVCLAGVKCDDCGTEMILPESNVVLTSYPPKVRVECPKCGKTGLKEN
jgi:ribosomal protein S27E